MGHRKRQPAEQNDKGEKSKIRARKKGRSREVYELDGRYELRETGGTVEKDRKARP